MVQRSERHETSEVLAAPGALIRELLRDAEVASFTIDSLQRIRLWDEAAERLFGFRASRVLGQRCCDVICLAEDALVGACRHHQSILRMASHGDLPAKVTMTLLRADGILLELEVIITPVLLSEDGHDLALLHLVRRLR